MKPLLTSTVRKTARTAQPGGASASNRGSVQPAKGQPFEAVRRSITYQHRKTNMPADEAGHGEFVLAQEEAKGVSQHLPQRLREQMPSEGPATFGHLDDESKPVLREKQRISRDGRQYNDKTREAAGPFEKFPQPMEGKYDMGRLRPRHERIIAKLIEQKPKLFSLYGNTPPAPKSAWTKDEMVHFMRTGEVPLARQSAPNCTDYAKQVVLHLGVSEGSRCMNFGFFVEDLKACTKPQELAAICKNYFEPGPDGFLSFKEWDPKAPLADEYYAMIGEDAPDYEPKPTSGLVVGKPFYGDYQKACGVSGQAFRKLTDDLVKTKCVPSEIFEDPKNKQWGTAFFSGLGKQLAQCSGEKEFVMCFAYFKGMYPGRITHIAQFGITKAGDLAVLHHEMIDKADGAPRIDNLFKHARGLPSNTFDTKALHRQITGKTPERLPVDNAVGKYGPPLVHFKKAADFEGFKDLTDDLAAQSFVVGEQWFYGTDPDALGAALAGGVRLGMLGEPSDEKVALTRFLHDPAIAPPGGNDPTLYSNNCARLTLIGSEAAKVEGFAESVGTYDPTWTLTEQARALYKLGAMPETSPQVFDEMDRAGHVWDSKGYPRVHVGSFLRLGVDGWSDAPGEGASAAHVPRNTLEGEAAVAEDKERQKAAARLQTTMQSNEKTFSGLLNPGGADKKS